MSQKDLLGEFEHQVLLALLRQRSDGYSVTIVLELEERTGREVSAAAVHIALRRLEDKGLALSEMRNAAPTEGGRERRYYTLTAEGRERLQEARRIYRRLWEGIEPELEES
jgi:DNA-binding PadR family transcriptional regulator